MSFGVHGLNSSYNTTNKKAHVVKVTCVGNTAEIWVWGSHMLLIQVKGIHTLGFRFFFFFYTVADKRYQEEIKKGESYFF